MTPTTRSKALLSRSSSPSPSCASSSSSSSSDSESDPDTPTVRSPSKLIYKISHLPPETQAHIRDVFSDPPQLALQRCRLVDNEEDREAKGTYAFQMTELVTRSVRIRRDGVSCSCSSGGDDEEKQAEDVPCGHLLWLMDRIAEKTVYQRGQPLEMTEEGYPSEMDDPFTAIADHTLSVLGPSLHCPVVNSPNLNDKPDTCRPLEARELLASAHGETPDSFRPDIFSVDAEDDGLRCAAAAAAWSKIWKRGDLDLTISKMLLENHHFFWYFLGKAESADGTVRDPFKRLGQRVERILQVLDGHVSEHATTERVPWAAKHIIGCTGLVRSLIFTRSRPLSPSESLSAARVLVHILTLVTSPSSRSSSRDLYLHLIGDQDRDFVIGILGLVPPAAASHFLDALEGCLEDIGRLGAPAGYVERFRGLLERLRTSNRGLGVKRAGQEAVARGSKRMK